MDTVAAPVELTEDEISQVSGAAIMCSNEPAVKLAMYLATGGMMMSTQPGGFACVET